MSSLERVWTPDRPISLRLQLGPLRRGTGDPTWGSTGDGAIWRTTLTPAGPGLERLSVLSSSQIRQQVWGAGGEWLIDRLPTLLGAHDDPSGFVAPGPLAATQKAYRHWRVGRTDRVLEALVPAILEQKVTGKQAWQSWRSLIREYGTPAPIAPGAPAGLRVFPGPQVWLMVPTWSWHQAGVDSKRSAAVVRAAAVAESLERCGDLSLRDARARLRAIPGVGIWTVAEVAQRALGDPDAVSYGDYHVAQEMVYALTGARDGTDEQMALLLKPFAGHRYRVQRLLELAAIRRPRHGPKLTIYDMRNK